MGYINTYVSLGDINEESLRTKPIVNCCGINVKSRSGDLKT